MMEYWSMDSSNARMLYWHDNQSKLLVNPLGYDIHSELYNSMILQKKVYDTNIELLNCYIAKTKPTNLVIYPLIYRFGVDENLKDILKGYRLMDNKFIKTEYVYRNKKYSDLNFLFWTESIYQYINFKLCEIVLKPRSEEHDTPTRIIQISDFAQFMETRTKGILTFTRVVFNVDAPIFDWFYIDGIFETNIVSNMLKKEIERRGFTGIRFTPSRIQWER